MSEIRIDSGEMPYDNIIFSQSADAAAEESIFFDRWDGHFLRYVAYLGLPFDATDREITALMEADLDARNTHLIYNFEKNQ